MVRVETQQTTSDLQGKVADIQVCGSSVLQCREPMGSLRKPQRYRERRLIKV